MRALTIWQPWASAVATCHRPLENRPWPPPRNLIGRPFALHAGKRWDDDATLCRNLGIDDSLLESRGAVICIATIDRVIIPDALPGTAEHVDTLTAEERRWYSGAYGWIFRDVLRLREPVPCRGFQHLWTLPPAIEAAVVTQIPTRPR